MNVVITGASKGIGKAIAKAFLQQGANVFLCARNEVMLYNTVAELQSMFINSKVKGVAFDVSVKEQAQQFGKWALDNCGKIDVLVNNAGSFLPGSIHSEEDGLLEQMIATNVYTAYHVTRAIVPSMIAQKSGHIFNMCSVASMQAYANGGSYSISKFALLGFSKNLREELKPHLVKVTSVCLGAVLTDSWGDFDNSNKRIMEAEDVAAMIVASSKLSPQAVVEDIVMRPQLGDL